jgi:predicted GIY-YIG superfamily endonuclease
VKPRMQGLLEIPRLDLVERYALRPPAKCWVYEIWDTKNRLAYVGIADNFERRWAQHGAKSWWLNEITIARVFLNGYRTRFEAQKVEAETIHYQSPVYNTRMEHSALAAWHRGSDNEDDCIPVKKRFFEGVYIAMV